MRRRAWFLAAVPVLLGPSLAGGTSTLSDDFGDGILDPGRWAAPYGDVVEGAGVCQLSRRGYLNTVQDFDSSILPVEVYCEWKWLQFDDNFSVAVRSSGVKQQVTNWGQVENGVFVTVDNYADGTFYVVRVVEGVGVELLRTWLPGVQTVGVWHSLRIVDDGAAITYYVDGELVAAVNEATAFATNLVTFYNRELIGPINATMELDNVEIRSLGPVPVRSSTWAAAKVRYR